MSFHSTKTRLTFELGMNLYNLKYWNEIKQVFFSKEFGEFKELENMLKSNDFIDEMIFNTRCTTMSIFNDIIFEILYVDSIALNIVYVLVG